MEWVKQRIAARLSPGNNDAKEGDEEGEIEVESVQQFIMTAPGPSQHINPRHHRQYLYSGVLLEANIRIFIISCVVYKSADRSLLCATRPGE